jgi:protein TonB
MIEDAPDTPPFAMMLRLLLIPSIVGILFLGGVYWLRLRVDATGGAPEQVTVVEVHLLPRPDPVPIPINQASQSAATSPPSPANGPTETAAALSDQAVAALPSEEAAAAEPVVPSAIPKATTGSVPNATTLAFKAELLRHIARFQRYPQAAERQHLRGTVDTEFAINRDGKLLGVWVKTSSGQVVLDQAAINTIRRAQPLPSIPSALPDTIKIEIALGFDPF